jgi:hypothetical protein
MAEGVEASVPVSVQETVELVGTLASESGAATVMDIARALKLDKSAASRRCRTAQDRGYIRNEETSKGRPARYVLADPLPSEQPVLPSPDTLAAALSNEDPHGSGCTVAVRTEEVNPSPLSETQMSDRPWREVVI